MGSSATAAAAVFRPPFPLVEAKLRVPATRPGLVLRPRLTARMKDPDGPRIVSLVAPAGYGKTTLLAQCTASCGLPVAWLTLDGLDNDPAVLLAYLVAAFDRIRPIDASIVGGIPGLDERMLAVAMPRLLGELHRWPAPAILALDDAHRLDDPTGLDAITAILDHLPAGFRVAMAGRTEPRLPFTRLRERGDVLELGPRELALDIDEATVLCASAGRPLDAEQVRRLVERTEGWAAGIYLATLTDPQAAAIAPADPARGSPGDRLVADYLRSEIGRELHGDLTFLEATSVLETIDPDVAEAVTGEPGAAERLAALTRRSLLVQAIDGGAAYRCHNLLREHLQGELRRRDPGRVEELHRRASDRYAARGQLDRAIEHAFAAGDPARAGRLIAADAVVMYNRGQFSTMGRWFARLDDGELEANPSLVVLAGWMHALAGHADDADRMADLADRLALTRRPADGSASFESQRALYSALVCRHGPRVMLADARRAVEAEPPESPWRPYALFHLGVAHVLAGEPDAAERRLEEAVAAGVQGGSANLAPLAMLAGQRIAAGDWAGAGRLAARARARLAETRYENVAPALMVQAVSARVAVHEGDLEGARRYLVAAQVVRPVARSVPWASVWSLVQLARVYAALGDATGAHLALREAEAVVRRRPLLGTLIDDLLEVRRQLGTAMPLLGGPSSLTAAELRVLPFLPTYLSFDEIGDRLSVSRNTVKSHAMSIYGKLGASSRGEAVERAVEVGLLEPYPVLASGPEARRQADR